MSLQPIPTFSQIAMEEAGYTLTKMVFMIPAAALLFGTTFRNQPSLPLRGAAFAATILPLAGIAQACIDWTLSNYVGTDQKNLIELRAVVFLAATVGTAWLFNYLGYPVVDLSDQQHHRQ